MMRQIHYALALMTTSALLNACTAVAAPGAAARRFDQVLQLASVSVVSDRSQAGSSIYLFTMTMPERAGKRFTRLSFSFTEPNREQTVAPIRFDLASTKAFTGVSKTRGQTIGIKDTWIDETGVLWIEFNRSMPPKTQLTLALKTLKSSPAATYNYGIAAYPETTFPAVFVGNGTLTIRR